MGAASAAEGIGAAAGAGAAEVAASRWRLLPAASFSFRQNPKITNLTLVLRGEKFAFSEKSGQRSGKT